ncbi:protein GrpE [Sphingomonas glacialis]|uniref:Protein GrpE n=1 Tax=Sphingomonas glacialis TaxID=658225 RepID=A0ABQ3LTA2_9SPHN|nr:nucleotide exchange factor GrpE [Sphingomonas glacialis]GHH25584.1 protein GrpE [Sphingomonas glacialis]
MITDHEKTRQDAETSHEDSVWTEPTGEAAPDGGGAGRIAHLETALAEMRERWVRSEAENANVRSRAKRDLDDMRHFAIETFARDVVEAAENLRRGRETLPPVSDEEAPSIAGIRAGLTETERGFVALLDRNGIKRVDPTGTAFDPNLHQAMAELVADGQTPGTILQALSPTWTLNGRLLRPAMVVVAKPPTDNPAQPR